MTCKHCGTTHFESVCPKCGTIVGQEYLRHQHDDERCTGCGKGLYGATKCTECGQQVPGTAPRR
jgi:hypothetical protein